MAFWTCQETNGKWHFVSPAGQPTVLRGANHYGDGSYMPVNLKERYGTVAAWRRSVRDRHRDWGFNYLPPSIGPSAVGCEETRPARNARGGMHWPDADIRRTPEWPAEHFAELEFPFTAFLEVPKQYMAGPGLPDVFSREFRQAVDKRCREFVAPLRDNPNLVGYHFCHNPPWHPSAPAFDDWIAQIVDDGRAAKGVWADLMRRIYGSPACWRRTYGIPVEDLSEIGDLPFPLRGYVSARNAQRDRLAFMERICREWYTVYSETIRRYDPNHLILGDRNTLHLQPLAEHAVRTMGEYVDVISVNVMGPADVILEELEQVTRHWDGPIHLADTGAGVYNGQFPKSAYMCTDIAEFETVYADLLRLGVSHPQIVGMGWCGYYETPSSRSGLVDSRTDEPLADRIEIATRWNRWCEDAVAGVFQPDRFMKRGPVNGSG